MKLRTSRSEKAVDFIINFILLVVILITTYPFLFVISASLSDPVRVMQSNAVLLWPKGFQIETYKLVFKNEMIGIGYRNTLIYLVLGTVLNVVLTAMGAYALSRKKVFGKNAVMFLIVFTMFFSGGMIPSFLLVKSLGMVNTIWAMFIPNAISVWNLIIMRTSFQAVPDSIIESAWLDGANDFTILFRLVIPLSLPVVSVIILFYGVYHWNDFFSALLYLRDRGLYPIQLVLRDLLITNSTDSMTAGTKVDKIPIAENIKYTVIVISTVPILLIYPFIQKYFIKGVMVGAIKE